MAEVTTRAVCPLCAEPHDLPTAYNGTTCVACPKGAQWVFFKGASEDHAMPKPPAPLLRSWVHNPVHEPFPRRSGGPQRLHLLETWGKGRSALGDIPPGSTGGHGYSSAACPMVSGVHSSSLGRSSASSRARPKQLVRRGEAHQPHPLPAGVAMAQGGREGPEANKGSGSTALRLGVGRWP